MISFLTPSLALSTKWFNYWLIGHLVVRLDDKHWINPLVAGTSWYWGIQMSSDSFYSNLGFPYAWKLWPCHVQKSMMLSPCSSKTTVACQNPPASSDEQHEEPGGSQDCWWALVPRATARKLRHTSRLMWGRATWPIPGQEGDGLLRKFPAWQTRKH
jgi:hypothetical protein